MRSTAHAPRHASVGDALGLIFFIASSAAVLVAVTGVDVLGREIRSEGSMLTAASAPCPATAD